MKEKYLQMIFTRIMLPERRFSSKCSRHYREGGMRRGERERKKNAGRMETCDHVNNNERGRKAEKEKKIDVKFSRKRLIITLLFKRLFSRLNNSVFFPQFRLDALII